MNWLKTGLGVGRYKLGKYQDEVALGATLEDEYHDYFKPYLEWDWQISNGCQLLRKPAIVL